MAHDPVRVDNTRAWLLKAAEDLRAAHVVLSASPPLLWDAMFHCQQAAEKALKSFLTWRDLPFTKTHDLVELGRGCVEVEPEMAPLLPQAAYLTRYASGLRYPGELPEPPLEEARRALVLAREIVDAILTRLPAEARP